MMRWNGEGWRWREHLHRRPTSRTISVIERTADQEQDARDRDEGKLKAGARRVPFGFARALGPPAVECEPMLWEGDQA